jgi:hypothetical protein
MLQDNKMHPWQFRSRGERRLQLAKLRSYIRAQHNFQQMCAPGAQRGGAEDGRSITASRRAMGTPAKIMIIRHAEKPPEKGPPFGIGADGEEDNESLTVKGWQRAGGLAALFAPPGGVLCNPHLATPAVIYASPAHDEAPHGAKQAGSKSKRPHQTVAPLAAKLNISIDLSFQRGEEAALAANVLTRTGVVLISWQHELIVEIVRHLVSGAPPEAEIPAHWSDKRFDVIWVFTPPNGVRQKWGFVQVPQMLLQGDLPSGI